MLIASLASARDIDMSILEAQEIQKGVPPTKDSIKHRWQLVECFWESAKCQIEQVKPEIRTNFMMSDSTRVESSEVLLNETVCYW